MGNELGSDTTGQKLEAHQTKVNVLIKMIIEKGYKKNVRLDWNAVEKQSLKIITSRRIRTRAPGKTFYIDDEYVEVFKQPFDTHPKKEKGEHYRGSFRGAPGIWVKDAPGVRVTAEDEMCAQLEADHGDNSELLSPDELHVKGAELSAGFMHDLGIADVGANFLPNIPLAGALEDKLPVPPVQVVTFLCFQVFSVSAWLKI